MQNENWLALIYKRVTCLKPSAAIQAIHNVLLKPVELLLLNAAMGVLLVGIVVRGIR